MESFREENKKRGGKEYSYFCKVYIRGIASMSLVFDDEVVVVVLD